MISSVTIYIYINVHISDYNEIDKHTSPVVIDLAGEGIKALMRRLACKISSDICLQTASALIDLCAGLVREYTNTMPYNPISFESFKNLAGYSCMHNNSLD